MSSLCPPRLNGGTPGRAWNVRRPAGLHDSDTRRSPPCLPLPKLTRPGGLIYCESHSVVTLALASLTCSGDSANVAARSDPFQSLPKRTDGAGLTHTHAASKPFLSGPTDNCRLDVWCGYDCRTYLTAAPRFRSGSSLQKVPSEDFGRYRKRSCPSH
jgi:hypothetical protein